tara:strand:- start:1791 stop:1925 length:135 start_codon:yes stop_codon:yes gene_type:complete
MFEIGANIQILLMRKTVAASLDEYLLTIAIKKCAESFGSFVALY